MFSYPSAIGLNYVLRVLWEPSIRRPRYRYCNTGCLCSVHCAGFLEGSSSRFRRTSKPCRAPYTPTRHAVARLLKCPAKSFGLTSKLCWALRKPQLQAPSLFGRFYAVLAGDFEPVASLRFWGVPYGVYRLCLASRSNSWSSCRLYAYGGWRCASHFLPGIW